MQTPLQLSFSERATPLVQLAGDHSRQFRGCFHLFPLSTSFHLRQPPPVQLVPQHHLPSLWLKDSPPQVHSCPKVYLYSLKIVLNSSLQLLINPPYRIWFPRAICRCADVATSPIELPILPRASIISLVVVREEEEEEEQQPAPPCSQH